MTVWQIILLASIAVLAIKLAGYLVPERVLQTPTAARTANLVTVALLSALIVVQTIGAGQGILIDARLPAVVVAAGLFAIRTPFIVVIIAAAGVAAALRALGWAA
ncbi:AzlD domain-containing protein [Microcella alkalica]|uniref:AzlD domain-containing protein n=1 Tax=Microcella alkalica TaxID=355930 RepID=UPI00145D8163|nr:AzlD domain-containing protein [Microcella alkalica]